MPLPTPFHGRTAALCESHEWRDWAGYLAAATYEPSHEREYYAIRNAAALIDVSPLFKYDISGSDAERLLNRTLTRDVSGCRVGQVLYSAWCDERGKMVDDGTIWRLEQEHFRLTAAEPNLRWLQDCGRDLEVTVTDTSDELAALALQGPRARRILAEVLTDVDLDRLGYYRLDHGHIRGFPVTVTRTGFTGDLGYELWLAPGHAGQLWDILLSAGSPHGLLPAGMVALDIARIEAGLLLIDVDYVSARHALTEAKMSSPYEAGLGWTVALDKGPFVGRQALADEQARGPTWRLVGLEIDWPALEALYARYDLPPQVAGRPSRQAEPVYDENAVQVGQATSRTFSPILKKYIALATVKSFYAEPGQRLSVELTVEFSRHRAPATVVRLPFFDPPRKRSLPADATEVSEG
ncbi:MAG: aminomethyltransferase family protein [Candidatus Promineifilaceae bacterium]|nr:aminomethyltransferase family protein [Candidatus Promineifilaceae bacterium]